jgi:hypothetical protein
MTLELVAVVAYDVHPAAYPTVVCWSTAMGRRLGLPPLVPEAVVPTAVAHGGWLCSGATMATDFGGCSLVLLNSKTENRKK